MPSRTPEEWDRFTLEEYNGRPLTDHRWTSPQPMQPNDLQDFAEAVRAEAFREAIEWCKANYRDDGTAQRCAEDIGRLIDAKPNT